MPSNVPATLGEILYVSLTHVLDYVDEHGTYPPHMRSDMRNILKSYAQERNRYLTQQGVSVRAINRYTLVSSNSLQKWLKNRASRADLSQDDFNQWQKELENGGD